MTCNTLENSWINRDMSRGNFTDKLIIDAYSKEFNLKPKTAREHRKKQHEQWVQWCNENGYDYRHIEMKNMKTIEKKNDNELEQLLEEVNVQQIPCSEQETITDTLVERYKLLEQTAFNQLRKTQFLLDEAINEQQFQTLRVYVGGVKDLTSTFNELCRLRQIAEVQEGRYLPMEVFNRYKTEFYPRLNNGLDEMKLAIENNLPADMVPEFQRAWNMAYYRYKDAAKEAENALNDYKELAQIEALQSIDKKENRREKAKNPVRNKIKKNK